MNFRFTKAEFTAKTLMENVGLDDPTEMPISDIILGCGAFYDEKPLNNKDGEIVSFGNRSVIHVNAELAFDTRKRFTAAHELGHFRMHRDIQPIFSDTELHLLCWYQGGEHEIEANEFAAEFLMPSALYHKTALSYRRFGPEVIEQLADKFQVSKTSAILRFVKRGSYPVMIVCCKDNKMKWWKKSDDFWPFIEFQKDLNPPTGSVAYEVFTSNKFYAGDERKQQIWKSDWFQMKDDEADSKFYEYCLYAKSFNYTISIIWQD
jgi:Zn-dependent peptidase ImmA (M78 family)